MPERDANIERLFNLVMETNSNTASIKSDLSVLTAKVDDFSNRLKKLEDKDEKHGDKEEKLNLLAQSLMSAIDGVNSTLLKTDKRLLDFDERLSCLEDDVTKIQSNWGWLMALISAAAGIIAYIINLGIRFFGGQ